MNTNTEKPATKAEQKKQKIVSTPKTNKENIKIPVEKSQIPKETKIEEKTLEQD